MSSRGRIFISLLIVSLLLPLFSLRAAMPNESAEIDSASIIVKFRGDKEPRKIAVPSGQKPEQVIARFSRLSSVEYAEPNYLVHASFAPSDTYLGNQWYLQRIKAREAWDVNTQSPTIIIAVIDSGIQIHHPDIESNIWTNPGEIKNNNKDDDRNGLVDDINGWDFVNNFADPSPKFKKGFTEGGIIHGTVVAGIAGATGNNDQGIAGITWKTKIMALKALDDRGNGDTLAVIKAIDYASAKSANIINLSFVGFGYSKALQEALIRARNSGVIVIAPAGNEQSNNNGLNLNDRPLYPACYRDNSGKKIVLGVAATDGIDQKASFSGFGNRCIDIAAPGISFYTTSVYAPDESEAGKFFNQYYDGYWSGTSMAVPLISGTLALIQGTNPGLSRDEAINILLKSADNLNNLNPGYVNQLGSGRVNVYAAVAAASQQLKNRTSYFAFAPARSGEPKIKITTNTGYEEREFLAYNKTFHGGLNLASGDLNRDGTDEIVAAPAKDLESDIRIFNSEGRMINHFLAYPKSYRGGVNLSVADLNGDGQQEIITAPAGVYNPEIKIFSKEGRLLRSFLAYPATFKGGVNITIADVRDDGYREIITAPGKGGIPQIKIFSREGKLLNSFLAGTKKDTYGYRVAAGDLDGNPRRRQAEIIVSRMSGAPIVSFYDFRGAKRGSITPFAAPFSGDVRISTADLNRDGFTDIITVPGSAGGPHLRIYNYQGFFINSFYAYPLDYNAGLSVTAFLIHN
jgi:subtilisin family serine protease